MAKFSEGRNSAARHQAPAKGHLTANNTLTTICLPGWLTGWSVGRFAHHTKLAHTHTQTLARATHLLAVIVTRVRTLLVCFIDTLTKTLTN